MIKTHLGVGMGGKIFNYLSLFFFFFFLGPGRMPQMHRSHIGLLCYPRIVQVFFDVPTFVTGPSSSSVELRGQESWPVILPKCRLPRYI